MFLNSNFAHLMWVPKAKIVSYLHGRGSGHKTKGAFTKCFLVTLNQSNVGGGGGGEGGEGGRGCDVKIDTCVPNISFVQFFLQ